MSSSLNHKLLEEGGAEVHDLRAVMYGGGVDWLGLTGLVAAFGCWLLGLAVQQFSNAGQQCGTDDHSFFTSCGAALFTGVAYLLGFTVCILGGYWHASGKVSLSLASINFAFALYLLAESVLNFDQANWESVCLPGKGTYFTPPEGLEDNGNSALCAVTVIDGTLLLVGFLFTLSGSVLAAKSYRVGKDVTMPLSIASISTGFGLFLLGTKGDSTPYSGYYVGADKGFFIANCVCGGGDDQALCSAYTGSSYQCSAVVVRSTFFLLGGLAAVSCGVRALVRNYGKMRTVTEEADVQLDR